MTPIRTLLTAVFALVCAVPSFATTWHVRADGGGDVATIAAAVIAAAPGDSIAIASGTYFEDSIVVNTPVFIAGSGATWPIIDGGRHGRPIFQVIPPGGASFRDLVLRHDGTGIVGRTEANPCGGGFAGYAAENIVAYGFTESGLSADNKWCAGDEAATWTRCTAVDCAVGFMINDFGSVTGSGLVAAGCAYATEGWDFNVASLDGLVLWGDQFANGGAMPPPMTRVLTANPLFCDSTRGDFHVAAASPCLPANNAWGMSMGALGQGCSAPVSVAEGAGVVPRIRVRPSIARDQVEFSWDASAQPRQLRVLDAQGRERWSAQVGGRDHLEWRTRAASGGALAAGVYFVVLEDSRGLHAARFVIRQ